MINKIKYIKHGAIKTTLLSLLNKINKDVYTSNGDTQSGNYSSASSHKGDAIYETSSSGDGSPNYEQSWYSDYSYMSYSNNPFFKRGGIYRYGPNAGLFYFSYHDGNADCYAGFHPVLAVSDAF